MIRRRFLLIIFVILGYSCIHLPVWAQSAAGKVNDPVLPAIKVAFSDDQSIITERVLYAALKRAGYQMIAKAAGMRTAVADVNYGDAAILPAQTDGWDRIYPNLIKVPVVIDYVEFTVYSMSDKPYHFSRWSDLSGLRIGYRWQNEYIANNLHRTGASESLRVNDTNELWDSLLNGDTDAVLLPRFSHYEHRFPQGVKRSGVIEKQPVYSYVNNRYDYLVPSLEKAYQEMIADGTIESIQNGQKLSSEKPFILHINSNNAQNDWERSQMEYIRRFLETQTALEYYSIYLNSNEPHSQISYNGVISDMIRTEFIARYPDLIIASGNEAFEFALNNYYLLFPGLPILFFGVPALDSSMLYGLEENVTGVSETISFFETVSEMLELFPKTRRIFVLNDHYLSRSEKIKEVIQRDINTQLLQRNSPFEVVFSEDKTLPEILDDIRSFDSDTLVLIGNYISDSGGTFYSETDIQKLVSQASVNPVFCLTTSYMGHGTFGGLVSSTSIKNNTVASMAAKILEGTPPGEIPVIYDSIFLNQWQFDYETMKRFKINVKNLPRYHFPVNRSLPVWESNPAEFRLSLVIAALFMLIISGLIVFFIRNNRMTKILHNTAMQLEITAKEANNANEAKSNFLAKMSHEIRTPMNAILGIAEIQLRDGTLTSESEEAIRKIYESGDVLLNIINDILDLSKIEAGKMELIPVKYDIPSLINDTMQLNRLRYESKPIELFINVDENTPHYLLGDELRIKQVLNNIISNAFKYTDKGSVSLFVHSETIDNNNENVTVVFRVCDTGQGMTKEQLEKLFDEYTRFNAKANRETVGTGLGMSITKHLLNLMNGEISVKSEKEKGSEFIVRIPQQRAGSEVCGKEITEKLRVFNFRSATLTNKTQFLREYMPYGSILVVDDVESNIYVTKGMLLPYGIKVDTASSGFEAIKKVEEGNVYDIVFMDHMMPKMDGIETTKRIRDMGYNHTIVALTANALIGRAEMFMKNGFDGFISKPIDSRELNLMLNELIRNKKPPEVIEEARKKIAHAAEAAPQNDSSASGGNKPTIDDELFIMAAHDIENAVAALEELLPEINSDPSSDDIQLFITTVHGMKSALANIGEMKLSHTALRLEHAGTTGEIALILTETPVFIDTLRLFLEKINKHETDSGEEKSSDVSRDDEEFLRNKLNEIKMSCDKLIVKDAKTALNELKKKTWPRKINNIIDEISLYIIRGEFAKAASSAADTAVTQL
ncbi:MAG: ATP-binding protein [Treponema sp.]|nr:ATP-binding protein [Treponema sp.]MCL2272707.1 ATP-binding protein [Treponema sp.]